MLPEQQRWERAWQATINGGCAVARPLLLLQAGADPLPLSLAPAQTGPWALALRAASGVANVLNVYDVGAAVFPTAAPRWSYLSFSIMSGNGATAVLTDLSPTASSLQISARPIGCTWDLQGNTGYTPVAKSAPAAVLSTVCVGSIATKTLTLADPVVRRCGRAVGVAALKVGGAGLHDGFPGRRPNSPPATSFFFTQATSPCPDDPISNLLFDADGLLMVRPAAACEGPVAAAASRLVERWCRARCQHELQHDAVRRSHSPAEHCRLLLLRHASVGAPHSHSQVTRSWGAAWELLGCRQQSSGSAAAPPCARQQAPKLPPLMPRAALVPRHAASTLPL